MEANRIRSKNLQRVVKLERGRSSLCYVLSVILKTLFLIEIFSFCMNQNNEQTAVISLPQPISFESFISRRILLSHLIQTLG